MAARYVAGIRFDGSGSLGGKATGQSTLAGVLTPGAVPGEKRERQWLSFTNGGSESLMGT